MPRVTPLVHEGPQEEGQRQQGQPPHGLSVSRNRRGFLRRCYKCKCNNLNVERVQTISPFITLGEKAVGYIFSSFLKFFLRICILSLCYTAYSCSFLARRNPVTRRASRAPKGPRDCAIPQQHAGISDTETKGQSPGSTKVIPCTNR